MIHKTIVRFGTVRYGTVRTVRYGTGMMYGTGTVPYRYAVLVPGTLPYGKVQYGMVPYRTVQYYKP